MTTSSQDEYEYLLSLRSIRDKAKIVRKAAETGNLCHFDFQPEKMGSMADIVTSVILRDFSISEFSDIPPHGRWQHFETQSISRLETTLESWRAAGVDNLECSRRLVDLFLASVLLDAGAGDVWSYTEEQTGLKIGRSEGLAVASLYAFKDGLFSGSQEASVDARGLAELTFETLAKAMQSTSENELVGVSGRAELLRRLGDSLLKMPHVFGLNGRPGNMIDHLLKQQSANKEIHLDEMWKILQDLLIPTWPTDRTCVDGKQLGDAWPLQVLKDTGNSSGSNIQPFHKLTQWLTYSLMVIFERLLGVSWIGASDLTGLPEYRNGGLLVDSGVLKLKPEVLARGIAGSSVESLPEYPAADDVIVEWRAMTVILLDETLNLVNDRLANAARDTKSSVVPLSLAQLLEAGTWKSGRELAAKYRPKSLCSPILVKSDGTLF